MPFSYKIFIVLLGTVWIFKWLIGGWLNKWYYTRKLLRQSEGYLRR